MKPTCRLLAFLLLCVCLPALAADDGWASLYVDFLQSVATLAPARDDAYANRIAAAALCELDGREGPELALRSAAGDVTLWTAYGDAVLAQYRLTESTSLGVDGCLLAYGGVYTDEQTGLPLALYIGPYTQDGGGLIVQHYAFHPGSLRVTVTTLLRSYRAAGDGPSWQAWVNGEARALTEANGEALYAAAQERFTLQTPLAFTTVRGESADGACPPAEAGLADWVIAYCAKRGIEPAGLGQKDIAGKEGATAKDNGLPPSGGTPTDVPAVTSAPAASAIDVHSGSLAWLLEGAEVAQLPISVSASSVRPDNTSAHTSYDPAFLLDGDNDTSWQATDAEGATLTLWLGGNETYQPTELRVQNGYWKNENRYYRNCRAKDIRVTQLTGDGAAVTAEYTLLDAGIDSGWQTLALEPMTGVTQVQITIRSSYESSAYGGQAPYATKDTAINELRLYGKAVDWQALVAAYEGRVSERLSIASATGTTADHYSTKGAYYGPANLIDGDDATSWQYDDEDLRGEAPGFVLWLNSPSRVDVLAVHNGFWKVTQGYDQYARNGRVRSGSVGFSYRGGAFVDWVPFTWNDTQTEQRIDLGGRLDVTAVCLRVDATYAGNKFPQTAISELWLYGSTPAY